jgi:hypothetical protein
MLDDFPTTYISAEHVDEVTEPTSAIVAMIDGRNYLPLIYFQECTTKVAVVV